MSVSNAQFLNPPPDAHRYETAEGLILPVPFEATTSYGKGTAQGPHAILEASHQVEFYDRETDSEPILDYGLHTLEPMQLPAVPEKAIDRIADQVEELARSGKLVCVLGGEHTISLGVARGLQRALGGNFTIVQLDAHSDLREEYDGSPYSHACVARRLAEEPYVEQILQLGIRSVCPEEVQFARSNPDRIRVWYSEEVHETDWVKELENRIRGKRVFLTLDVDGLDPSVVSATGTPEPDGLSWRQAMQLLRSVTACSEVIGFDCVELAPIPGDHASDYAVAKLVYKTVNLVLRSRKEKQACQTQPTRKRAKPPSKK